MVDKKDYGKFTIRFSLSDPQQKRAACILNELGRSKAQFLTNAILYYVDGFGSSQSLSHQDRLQAFVCTTIEQYFHAHEQITHEEPHSMPERNTPFDEAGLSAIVDSLQFFRK